MSKKIRERIKRIIAQENRLRARRRKMGKHGGGPKMAAAKTASSGPIKKVGADILVPPVLKRGDLVWFRDPDGEIKLYGPGRATWGVVINSHSICSFNKEGEIVERWMPNDAALVSTDRLMNQLPSAATLSLTTNIALLSQYIANKLHGIVAAPGGKSKSKNQIRNLLVPQKEQPAPYTETDERLVEL